MNSHKRQIHSTLLNRAAHADVFEIGANPQFLVVLIGGSGVDEEEYDRRSHSVIPIFDPLLGGFANRSLQFVLVYVTAPYDVPFNRFATEHIAAANWNSHVTTELLEPWSRLPYFVCGFSGGAALALNGLQNDPRCFGGAVLGADAVPPDFACPNHWREKLRLYCAPDDRVCHHPANRRVADTLVSRDQAVRYQLRSGGHSLMDYCTTDGLGDVIAVAHGIAGSGNIP